MKANELRIGNLVGFGESILEVCFIEEDSFRAKDNENQTWKNTWADIKPIPLTEEWLLKFGFEKNRDSFSKNIGLFSQGERLSFSGGYLYITDSEEPNTIPTDVITLWNKDVMNNLYVHQLQNLYYALTGEELILKND